MLYIIWIVLSVFVYLMVQNRIIPVIAKANFPLEKMSEYFSVQPSEIIFSTLEYSKTPFHHKKYLKNHIALFPWISDFYNPKYIYFYKIKISSKEYWLVHSKKPTLFGLGKQRKYILYSDLLEYLTELLNK